MEVRNADKSFICLLGQKISVERKALKIRDFDVFSNGVTPRLHLLKVNYPIKIITAVICYAWMIAVFINSKNGNTIQAIEDYD